MLDDLGILATIGCSAGSMNQLIHYSHQAAINIKEEEVADYLKTVIFRSCREP